MVHQGYIEPHNAVGIYNSDGHATIYCSTQGAFDVRSMSAAGARDSRGQHQGRAGRDRRRLRRQDHHLSRAALAAAVEEDRPSGEAGDEPRRGAARQRSDLGLHDQAARWARPKTARSPRPKSGWPTKRARFPGSPVAAGRDVHRGALQHPQLPRSTATTWSSTGPRPRPTARPARPTPRLPPRPSSMNWPRSAASIRSTSASSTAPTRARRRPPGLRTSASGLIETVEAIKNSPHYKSKLEGNNRGRGVATGFWFNAGLQSSAMVNIHNDGTASVVTGSVDIGGSRASMAMITAEVLGLDVNDVRPLVADTDSIGHTDVTGGSRVTFATGLAVYEAAQDAVRQLKERAAKIWEKKPEDVDFSNGLLSAKSNGVKPMNDQGPRAAPGPHRRPDHRTRHGQRARASVRPSPPPASTSKSIPIPARSDPARHRSPGRRQGDPSQLRRGPDAGRHRRRASAGRSTRSTSTTPRARCVTPGCWTTGCRPASTCR